MSATGNDGVDRAGSWASAGALLATTFCMICCLAAAFVPVEHVIDVPFAEPGSIQVLIFTRSDCPIANRYAPEIRRLCAEYTSRGVRMSLIYPDARETNESMESHLREYDIPCPGVLDPQHRLVFAARVTVTPEAVVYNLAGRQVYRGRIDDRFADFTRSRREPASRDLRDVIEACVNCRPIAERVTPAVGCLISDLQ